MLKLAYLNGLRQNQKSSCNPENGPISYRKFPEHHALMQEVPNKNQPVIMFLNFHEMGLKAG